MKKIKRLSVEDVNGITIDDLLDLKGEGYTNIELTDPDEIQVDWQLDTDEENMHFVKMSSSIRSRYDRAIILLDDKINSIKTDIRFIHLDSPFLKDYSTEDYNDFMREKLGDDKYLLMSGLTKLKFICTEVKPKSATELVFITTEYISKLVKDTIKRQSPLGGIMGL